MRARVEAASEEQFGDLLRQLADGDQSALRRIVPFVYAKLRRIARRQLARERHGHTFDSIALVNEVFMSLAAQERLMLNDRAHFLAVSARAMRRILVDHARARNADKRGGGARPLCLDDVPGEIRALELDDRLLALNEALDRLATIDSQAASIVEQRYFAGATEEEVSRVLGVSPATLRRRWAFAKAWLYRELSGP